MIITERLTINNRVFVRTSSDTGHMIERDGVLYEEAIDPEELGRTYAESAEIPEISAEEALAIILGGKT